MPQPVISFFSFGRSRTGRPHRSAPWLLLIGTWVGVLGLLPIQCGQASSLQLIGRSAPDFALRSVRGDNLRLSEHVGEVVALHFWATWCGDCRREMPVLEEIHLKYRRAGLVLLGISLDEDRMAAGDMARSLKTSYPLLFDDRKQASRDFQVSTLPVTVLIDRAGIVRYVSEGYKPGQEQRYTEKLRELLNE